MVPHYLEVSAWLALAAVTFAWIALAAYLTMVVIAQDDATRAQRSRWIAALWLLPFVGVAVVLVARRAQSPRAIVGHRSGRSRFQ
ncbi:hypothetical protein [Williamsia deligens]|uniref:Phospholipase_D-nuclease N-terminal n=1 Tax=Williamsia deligens TaxID=321325 RepID=A0ABW3G9P9_9NOCA|nr:hypothetical protein [Williamsia deligens]MCP2193512.1 hypothetical protein [Williamsia deligens]